MTSYPEVTEWLYRQLPMYQNQGEKAYKADLSNILSIVDHVDNPHLRFKSIHIAGTNGKGSTSHMLASILQEAGYKTGLYTSPHLVNFRERIRINGIMISEAEVVSFVEQNKTFFTTRSCSFFEMTVGLAFHHFAQQKVDIAVVETGLGGRLDSTNIIIPEVSVITNVGFDHTHILGDTLPKIAEEKAGIIKESVPVVIGEYHSETFPVFVKKAQRLESPLYKGFIVKDDQLFVSDLRGTYQKENQKTVLTTIDVLRKQGWRVTGDHMRRGIAHCIQNTGLQGRWQQLGFKPLIIADVAHNKEGLEYTLRQIMELADERTVHFVLGFVADKDLRTIFSLLPKNARYYFCKPDLARAMPLDSVEKEAKRQRINCSLYTTVSEAYMTALQGTDKEDVIYVGGSTFVVAEVLRFLEQEE